MLGSEIAAKEMDIWVICIEENEKLHLIFLFSGN